MLELRMGAQELIDDAFVFFRFSRARTIDQHPAVPQAESRRVENLNLQGMMAFELPARLSPLRFGVPTQDAETAAGRIDEDPIEEPDALLRCHRTGDGVPPRRIPNIGGDRHNTAVS